MESGFGFVEVGTITPGVVTSQDWDYTHCM